MNMNNALLIEASPRQVPYEEVPPLHGWYLLHSGRDGFPLQLAFHLLYVLAPNEQNCVQLGGKGDGVTGWILRRGLRTSPHPLSVTEQQQIWSWEEESLTGGHS